MILDGAHFGVYDGIMKQDAYHRTNIHFTASLLARLSKHCKKTGEVRAEFIRAAVEAALKKLGA